MACAFNRKSVRGFSLIEVLVAVVILSVGLLALASLQLSMVRASAATKAQTMAANIAKDRIEELRSYPDLAGYVALSTAAAPGDTLPLPDSGGNQGGVDFTRKTLITRYVYNKAILVHNFVTWANNNSLSDTAILALNNVDGVTSPQYVTGKDFKLIKVTVSWTEASGATPSVALEDIVDSLDPTESAKIAQSATTSGGARPVEERILNPASDPMVIPIALGGGVDSAATNPKPTVVVGTSTVETRFDVLTYAGLSGVAATAQAKVETTMVGCSCTLDTPLPTVRGKRPTYWNGYRYTPPVDVASSGPESYLPHGHQDPAYAGSYDKQGNFIVNKQSEFCDICCRDHEDPANVTGATFSPRLVVRDSSGKVTTPHRHYLDKLQPVGSFATGVYKEACRVIRVDGFWSLAADLSNDYFALLATGDGNNANAYAPNKAAVDSYQNFVAEVKHGYLDARFISPTPAAGTEQATYNTISGRPIVPPAAGASDPVATALAATSRYAAMRTSGPVTLDKNDTGTPVCTTITGISTSNPAIVTHPTGPTAYNNCAPLGSPSFAYILAPVYATGDEVNITGVVGTMPVNGAGTSYVIGTVTPITFTLLGVDTRPSHAYAGTYTSGGVAEVSHGKWLHSRGLYVDYLEKEATDAITTAKSQPACNTATVNPTRSADEVLSLCILKLLPFTSINLTEIADWDSADTSKSTVTNNNYADTRTSTEPVRGETSFVGGANGSTVNVTSRSRLGNTSLLDLSFDSISLADDTRVPDAQTFQISNTVLFPKPGNGIFYTTLSLPLVTGLGTNYVTGTQASKSCFYDVPAGKFNCVVNNAESTLILPVDSENAGLGIASTPSPPNQPMAIDVVGYNSKGIVVSTTSVPGCTGPFGSKTYVSSSTSAPVNYTLNTCSNYAVTAASNTSLAAAALGTAPYTVTGDGTQAEKTRISFANINIADNLSVVFGGPVTTTQPVSTCTYVCAANNSSNTDCESTDATKFTITSTACP